MKFLLSFCAALLLLSCSQPQPSWQKEMEQSKSILIRFGTDSAGKTMEAADTVAIQQIARYIGAKEVSAPKQCPADGTITFIRPGGAAQPVQFHLKESCRYFSFVQGGKQMYTSMSNEAFDFLEALRTGRSFY